MASTGIQIQQPVGRLRRLDAALRDISLEIPPNQIFGIIGPANSRQDHAAEVHQPHDRFRRHGHGRRTSAGRRAGRAVASATSTSSGGGSAWSFRCRWDCRCRSTTTWPMARGWPAFASGANWTRWSRRASARRCCGTRSRTGSNLLGTKLSGGQQQRLTLARALSLRPEILCLDEFSIAIDPVTTMKIEEVLLELKQRHDDRAGDEPGAAGPAAGQTHGLFERLASDRSGRDEADLYQARAKQLTYDYVTGDIG